MEKKHYLHVSGQALVNVTYTYEITDLEAFKRAVDEKRPFMEDINCLWRNHILTLETPYVKYAGVEYEDIERDTSYNEINGSTSEVEEMIMETELDGLCEWINY